MTRPRMRTSRKRSAPTHQGGGSDLLLLVAKIAQDFEELDSLIESQRQLLLSSAEKGTADPARARQRLKRIRASATDVANKARETIQDLDQPTAGA